MTVGARTMALAVATAYYERLEGKDGRKTEKTDAVRNALIAEVIQPLDDPECQKVVDEALSGMTPFQRLVFGMSEGLFGGYTFDVEELTTILSTKAGRPIDAGLTFNAGPLLSARTKLHPGTRQLPLF